MAAGTQDAPRERQAITRRLALAVSTLALAALLAIPAAAMAGKPGGGGSSPWIRLNTPDGLVAAGPSLGSWVSFSSSYPRTVKNPGIEVLCYQAGSLVYGEAGGAADAFLLGGGWSLWRDRGGSADCVANLFYFGSRAGKQTYEWLAETRFSAGG